MSTQPRTERAPVIGRRGWTVIALTAAALFSAFALGLTPGGLWPRAGGAQIAREFLGAALHPALDYESGAAPSGAPHFLLRLLDAVRRTLLFASASMGLAVVLGLLLAIPASTSWWQIEGEQQRGWQLRAAPWIRAGARVLIALMRSVHELLWAVLFLAAFGLNTGAAVLALALPFAGILAKVFSELLDEAPPHSALALRALGASPLRVFAVGILPRALPDMAAYAFYRFECAVRSAAVLGFFGYETLGYYLQLSFENLHYREVWTYLYAMIALVLLLEAWSAQMRRRFLA